MCNHQVSRSPSSSVGIVTKLRAGRPGFGSRQEQVCFVFATAPRPARGAHPDSRPMDTRRSFPGGKIVGE
jgi:hypothetical protein